MSQNNLNSSYTESVQTVAPGEDTLREVVLQDKVYELRHDFDQTYLEYQVHTCDIVSEAV